MSLFRRVARYRVGVKLDPRENRLTEVTAALLERVDGLALELTDAMVARAAAVARDRIADAVCVEEAGRWQTALSQLEALAGALRALGRPRLHVDTSARPCRGSSSTWRCASRRRRSHRAGAWSCGSR